MYDFASSLREQGPHNKLLINTLHLLLALSHLYRNLLVCSLSLNLELLQDRNLLISPGLQIGEECFAQLAELPRLI